jgi:hypothetical protein
MLYTHYFGAFTLIGQALWHLIENFNFKKPTKIIKGLFPFFISGVLYLPWVATLLSQARTVTDSYWLKTPNIKEIIRVFTYLFSGGVPQALGSGVAIVVLIFFASIDWKHLAKGPKALLVIFICPPIISLFVSLVSTPIFFERYLILFVIGIVIFLSVTVNKILMPLLLLLIFVFGYFSYKQFFTPSRPQIKEAIAYIKAQTGENDYIINYGDLTNHLFESKYYGLSAPIYTFNKIPSYMGTILMSEGDVINSLPRVKGKLGIITNNYLVDGNIPGYKIISVKQFLGVNVIWEELSSAK